MTPQLPDAPDSERGGRAPRPVPETSWGFLAYCVGVLGQAAVPLTVAGFLAYGVYKFVEQANLREEAVATARREADEQFQARFREQEVRLMEAYGQITDLSAKQLASVRELLTLHDDAMRRFEDRLARTVEEEARAQAIREQIVQKEMALERRMKTESHNSALRALSLTNRARELDALQSQAREQAQATGPAWLARFTLMRVGEARFTKRPTVR